MRAVIVTGGTKGLGREIALEFARRGDFVFALFHADEEAARQFQKSLADLALQGIAVRHDVAGPDGKLSALWEREEIQRATDLVLVNNASATFQPKPLHLLNWADFERGIEVAVKGSWSCTQAALRPMIKAGSGTIVNVLTTAIEGVPPKGFAAYATAKHALRGLTLSLAGELSARGIRVFSVSPGLMDTPLTKAWDPRVMEAMRNSGTATSDPVQAGKRVVDLIESRETPGSGEDYRI